MKIKFVILAVFIIGISPVVCNAQVEDKDLFLIRQSDKFGYIDRNGNIVIPPKFGYADDFHEGMAVVREDYLFGPYGFINTSGELVIDYLYENVSCFSDGLAFATSYDYETDTYISGFIDKTGNMKIKLESEYPSFFSEGLARYDDLKSSKSGYVDTNGKIVIKPKFIIGDGDVGEDFSEGMAPFRNDNWRYGFIDKKGKVVIKPRFSYVGDFSEGLAVASEEGNTISVGNLAFGKYGYIDKKGKFIIEQKYAYAFDFSEGRAIVLTVSLDDGTEHFSCIDASGKCVFDFGSNGYELESIKYYDGLLLVSHNGKYVFVDKFGKPVVSTDFSTDDTNFGVFRNGLAVFIKKLSMGYIDKQGNVVFETVPAAVDLGLPSGILWANSNVGAIYPEDYGIESGWAYGSLWIMMNCSWDDYGYAEINSSGDVKLTKYCNKQEAGLDGFVDSLTVIERSDDIASAERGDGWRMPTSEDFVELKENCTWTWISQNESFGYKVTGPNGNSIFLPAAGFANRSSTMDGGKGGYYWSSSLDTEDPHYGQAFLFNKSKYDMGRVERCYGLHIRPVYEK